MKQNDFEIGKTYKLVIHRSAVAGEVIPSTEILRKVLEPASKDNTGYDDGSTVPDETLSQWSQELRVENPETGHRHILGLRSIRSATPVYQVTK